MTHLIYRDYERAAYVEAGMSRNCAEAFMSYDRQTVEDLYRVAAGTIGISQVRMERAMNDVDTRIRAGEKMTWTIRTTGEIEVSGKYELREGVTYAIYEDWNDRWNPPTLRARLVTSGPVADVALWEMRQAVQSYRRGKGWKELPKPEIIMYLNGAGFGVSSFRCQDGVSVNLTCAVPFHTGTGSFFEWNGDRQNPILKPVKVKWEAVKDYGTEGVNWANEKTVPKAASFIVGGGF